MRTMQWRNWSIETTYRECATLVERVEYVPATRDKQAPVMCLMMSPSWSSPSYSRHLIGEYGTGEWFACVAALGPPNNKGYGNLNGSLQVSRLAPCCDTTKPLKHRPLCETVRRQLQSAMADVYDGNFYRSYAAHCVVGK